MKVDRVRLEQRYAIQRFAYCTSMRIASSLETVASRDAWHATLPSGVQHLLHTEACPSNRQTCWTEIVNLKKTKNDWFIVGRHTAGPYYILATSSRSIQRKCSLASTSVYITSSWRCLNWEKKKLVEKQQETMFVPKHVSETRKRIHIYYIFIHTTYVFCRINYFNKKVPLRTEKVWREYFIRK